jgi:hypothetical protein
MPKKRTEIDKEQMFNKIMPTRAKRAEQATPETENESASSVVADGKMPTGGKTPAVGKLPASVPRNTPANALKPDRQVEFFSPHRNTVMINVMERLVIEKLDSALSKFNSCKCDRCRQDIAAIALNKLPPKYVIIDKDEIDEYIKNSSSEQVTSSIIQAIFTVRAHPRH